MDNNPPVFKRVKERFVWQAMESVETWRKLFEIGLEDVSGNIRKLSLKEAAEQVGIPKKTLEDYHQLLRKVEQITSLEPLKQMKMGFLRQFLKDNKHKLEECQQVQQQAQEVEEEDFIPIAAMPEEFYYEEENNVPEPDWSSMIIEGDIQPRAWDDIPPEPIYSRRTFFSQDLNTYPTPYVQLILLPDITFPLDSLKKYKKLYYSDNQMKNRDVRNGMQLR